MLASRTVVRNPTNHGARFVSLTAALVVAFTTESATTAPTARDGAATASRRVVTPGDRAMTSDGRAGLRPRHGDERDEHAREILAQREASQSVPPLETDEAPGDGRPHPFLVPICPDVTVTIVSEAPDQDWSRATLRAPDARTRRALRFGGSIAGRRVVYVGHNPVFRSPAVWLTDGPVLCQALLDRPPPKATLRRQQATVRRANDGAHALTQLVERVDAESYRVDRKLLHLALDDLNALDPALRGVRGRLTRQGFHLTRVPAGTLPAVLGLKSGDAIAAIDGREISGPESLLAAYTRLSSGAPTKLTVQRGEETLRLGYRFE